MSALGKVSCLYFDVREQDSTDGNTDERTVLTPLNPNAVVFPNSLVCVRNSLGFLGVWKCGFIHLHRTVRTHVRSCKCKLITEPSLLNTDVWVSKIRACFWSVETCREKVKRGPSMFLENARQEMPSAHLELLYSESLRVTGLPSVV